MIVKLPDLSVDDLKEMANAADIWYPARIRKSALIVLIEEFWFRARSSLAKQPTLPA